MSKSELQAPEVVEQTTMLEIKRNGVKLHQNIGTYDLQKFLEVVGLQGW